MADLTEASTFHAGIYQIEQTDPVVGGPPDLAAGEGITNVPTAQLADRTRWLKDEIAAKTAPAALLTAVKTVDGTGSGLDADLLDGYNSADFPRKAEDATVSGSWNFTGTTLRRNGNDIWHAGNDGSGSGLDADLLDGNHASAFLLRSGGTMSGDIALGGNDLTNVGSIDFGGGDSISYSTTNGLTVFENGVFAARIGPNTFFPTTVQMNGALNVEGQINGEDNINCGGWYYQQGQRMCSQRSDYGITSIVLARKSGGGESFYGDTISGSNLQVCNLTGGNNNGDINVGTWRCLGYSAANSAGTEQSGTLWTRIL